MDGAANSPTAECSCKTEVGSTREFKRGGEAWPELELVEHIHARTSPLAAPVVSGERPPNAMGYISKLRVPSVARSNSALPPVVL